MSRPKKETGVEADTAQAEAETDTREASRPDYLIKQYRQIRNGGGVQTRKENIGAIWADATTGMLTIRMNGVQIISNDLYAHPVVYDFNGPT